MRTLAKTAALFMGSAMLSACQQNGSDQNKNTSVSVDNKTSDAKKAEGSWLPPQTVPVATYPVLTKVSPYAEMVSTVVADWGKAKNEFESTDDYNKRIASLPAKVTAKFGKFFAFRSGLPEVEWNADAKTLKILHAGEFKQANHLTLGLDAPVMYGMNVQGCATNPTLNMTSDEARAIKTGLGSRAIGLFYVGTIDFSKRVWVAKETLLNHETIPGFHSTAIQDADGGTGVWDFDYNVSRIDIVEAATGKVLESVKCAGE